jgi:hypothetical protein
MNRRDFSKHMLMLRIGVQGSGKSAGSGKQAVRGRQVRRQPCVQLKTVGRVSLNTPI